MSRQSRLSINDNSDNEMIPGAVYRSPGISLRAEDNPGKHHLGDGLMKAMRLKWDFLSSNKVGGIAWDFRERKEGKKERTAYFTNIS